MHDLQPRHIKLKSEECEELTKSLNISLTQLPKIKIDDAGLLGEYIIGDVVKIERKDSETGKTTVYYRVVAV